MFKPVVLSFLLVASALPFVGVASAQPVVPVGLCSSATSTTCGHTVCVGVSEQVPFCADLPPMTCNICHIPPVPPCECIPLADVGGIHACPTTATDPRVQVCVDVWAINDWCVSYLVTSTLPIIAHYSKCVDFIGPPTTLP